MTLKKDPDSNAQVPPHSRYAADLLLLSTALMWGTNILVFKYSITDLSPWVFNALRLIFATLTLGLLAFLEAQFWPSRSQRGTVGRWQFFCFAMFNGLLYLVTFVKGISLTTAGNTALILASMPMWTAVLSYIFLRERLPRITWLGLFVTLVGTVIVTTQGSGEVNFSSQFFLGNLLILTAAICWAGGTVISRPILQSITPLRLAFYSSALTMPLHLLIAAAEIPAALPLVCKPSTLAAIIYSGIFSTGIAYATWHAGVRALGGSHAAVYQNVVTLVAVIGGWIVLQEQPLLSQVLGGVLTVAGLFLMRRGRS